MLEQFKTVYWWNLDLQQEDKKIISLILFEVVPDHRKSLMPALVSELILSSVQFSSVHLFHNFLTHNLLLQSIHQYIKILITS